MSDTEKQEGQKTIISFISGLLIGGLLVWAFTGNAEKKENEAATNTTPEVQMTSSSTENTNTATTDTTKSDASTATKPVTTPAPAMTIGDGSIKVADQTAGLSVKLDGATYPANDGWIAVRTYTNGQLGSILGAARFSKTQGLIPQEVTLLAPTMAGKQYAVVFYSQDTNPKFNLDGDKQITTKDLATFTAK